MGWFLLIAGLVPFVLGLISFRKSPGWMGIRNRDGSWGNVILGLLLIFIGASLKAAGFLVFVGLLGAMVGLISIIKPLTRLHIKSRGGGAAVLLASIALIVIGLIAVGSTLTPNIPAKADPVPTQKADLKSSPVNQPEPPKPPPPPPPQKKEPKLEVKITSSSYEYGFLKVVGTVKNTGDAPAVSPTVKVQVRDETGTVLLAEDTALIAGQFLSKMEPGVEAAFQSYSLIPGEPARIKYSVTAK